MRELKRKNSFGIKQLIDNTMAIKPCIKIYLIAVWRPPKSLHSYEINQQTNRQIVPSPKLFLPVAIRFTPKRHPHNSLYLKHKQRPVRVPSGPQGTRITAW